MPEQMRARRGGVLGHQMATRLEQAAALDRKQRGAADRQLAAELLGGQPGIGGGHGQQGLPGRWQRGRLPRGGYVNQLYCFDEQRCYEFSRDPGLGLHHKSPGMQQRYTTPCINATNRSIQARTAAQMRIIRYACFF